MTVDFVPRSAEPRSRFGERLRLIRSALGLEPDLVAARAGLEWQFYDALEAGQEAVTAATIIRLARALQVDVALFFDPE